MNRRALIGVVAALVVAIVVIGGIHIAGSVVRRPEGAAERFLQLASRRVAKDRAKAVDYGDGTLARRLIDFPRKKKDDDFFSRIEVAHAAKHHGTVSVAFRVERNDAGTSKVAGTLVVQEQTTGHPHPWRVIDVGPPDQKARFPADGGPKPASVPRTTWLLAVAIGLSFTLGAETLLRSLGATRPVKRNTGSAAGSGPALDS